MNKTNKIIESPGIGFSEFEVEFKRINYLKDNILFKTMTIDEAKEKYDLSEDELNELKKK